MRVNIHGKLVDEREIRAGFIGCGSHAFRNLYPALQFVPVKVVATCDLDQEKAAAYAAQFGARSAYADYHAMLEKEHLDAVFICTGYDACGRPLYPAIAIDVLKAGCHVWMEKPPAAECIAIERMQDAAHAAQKTVLVGFKKMFAPANEKAKELLSEASFGTPHLLLLQYPQNVPTQEEFTRYFAQEDVGSVRDFLDHICHPVSLLIYLMGMPVSLSFVRSAAGGGVVTFSFSSGAIASLALTRGSSCNGGMEHTTIISDKGQQITVANTVRVSLHRTPPGLAYGQTPSFYSGTAADVTAVWEPEFSLGQLYNKGLFLLGYYNEINEFISSIREHRPPLKGTLADAWHVTRIFEAFAHGEGVKISLD